jgi:hypothetical protein
MLLYHANERMAEEHIRLVNKIYSLSTLPEEAIAVRKESYSSAYFIAGCVCQTGDPRIRRAYLRKAFLLCPYKYFEEYRPRLFGVIVPGHFYLLQHVLAGLRLLFTNPFRFLSALSKRLGLARN